MTKFAENSDVFPTPSVAVDERIAFKATGAVVAVVNVASPEGLVVTVVEPTNVRPWPFPEASATVFENSSMVNDELGVLWSVPVTVVTLFVVVTPVRTG